MSLVTLESLLVSSNDLHFIIRHFIYNTLYIHFVIPTEVSSNTFICELLFTNSLIRVSFS